MVMKCVRNGEKFCTAQNVDSGLRASGIRNGDGMVAWGRYWKGLKVLLKKVELYSLNGRKPVGAKAWHDKICFLGR